MELGLILGAVIGIGAYLWGRSSCPKPCQGLGITAEEENLLFYFHRIASTEKRAAIMSHVQGAYEVEQNQKFDLKLPPFKQ